MTKTDAALHPGQFFLERREKPGGNWETLYRDNDEDVMRIRFAYQVAIHLGPGQAVRLSGPDCKVIDEKEFDYAVPVCETVP